MVKTTVVGARSNVKYTKREVKKENGMIASSLDQNTFSDGESAESAIAIWHFPVLFSAKEKSPVQNLPLI